uniref:Hepcidin1 n=1 Tax=Chelon ramada TaxID=30804 RepID=A0A482G5X4_CHERA|nr:hepcidin1 [Chelon ramada]QBO59818.1 hepcidin1 [Chelon ramada]
MKIFSVAVAVAVVLTFICIQESSAVPVAEELELEVPMIPDTPDAHGETSVDSWEMLYKSRQKRDARCRFCCGCCEPGICGVCCRF